MSQSTRKIDGIAVLKYRFTPVSLLQPFEQQTNRHESKPLSQF